MDVGDKLAVLVGAGVTEAEGTSGSSAAATASAMALAAAARTAAPSVGLSDGAAESEATADWLVLVDTER